jgi:hypothetical protein
MEFSFKDFLPLLGTVITVITGYMLISVQIRKNRRAKWIEDFRKETAHLVWLNTPLVSGNVSGSKQNETIATAILIQMFLDRRIASHETLYKEMENVIFHATRNAWYTTDSPKVLELIQAILREEQAKI